MARFITQDYGGSMEFLIFAFITVVIFVVAYSVTTQSIKPPKMIDSRGASSFHDELSQNFVYIYYHDGTGYAFDVLDKIVAFAQNGNVFKYSISKIRDISRNWVKAGKTVIYGEQSLGTELKVSRDNAKSARHAYEETGLFVSIADIDNPMIHIKFVNEKDLLRAYEIFSQAIEGTLQIENKISINEQATNEQFSDLRNKRISAGLCTVCGGGLNSSKEKAQGYCEACRKK